MLFRFDAVRESLPDDSEPGETYPKTEIRNGNTFYSADGAKVDKSCLNRMGFKNVQSFKAWHGAFPFTHTVDGVKCGYPLKFRVGEDWIEPMQSALNAAATEWDSEITYLEGDYVYIGAVYYYALDATLGDVPATSPAKWARGVPNLGGTKYLKRSLIGSGTWTETVKWWDEDTETYISLSDPAVITQETPESGVFRAVDQNSGEISVSGGLVMTRNYQPSLEIFYDDEIDIPQHTPGNRLLDRKSTRLNSSHVSESRMPSSA